MVSYLAIHILQMETPSLAISPNIGRKLVILAFAKLHVHVRISPLHWQILGCHEHVQVEKPT